MTQLEQLAKFVVRASHDNLSGAARESLKIRVLDSLGCAIGALEGEPIKLVRQHTDDFGGNGYCTLIGGGRTAPDRAAFYNSALVRYLDFNDSFLAPGETCHPSDNLGAVLAATEYAGGGGRDFLTALAVAYQVQCRLSEVAPVRDKGFDHTTQAAYGIAAGVSKALGLNQEQTANAVAIAGTAFNALRVTRTGTLSHWKGLACPNTAFGATHGAFLAKRGITGPFEIPWAQEQLDIALRTMVKRFNAETHAQSAIEGLLELKREHQLTGTEVEQIHIETFDVAHQIIGGGEEGDKTVVRTKEQADHSLPFMLAVAVLDGQIMPEQYVPERICRDDAQHLLRKISVSVLPEFSRRFPDEMPCRVAVRLRDGREWTVAKRDFEGFPTRPMTWQTAAQKFEILSRPFTDPVLRGEIVDAVAGLELIPIAELTALLARVRGHSQNPN